MNTLFATITEIAKNSFRLSLAYTEDDERTVIRLYSDSEFELMIKQDDALENAQADGFSINWKSIVRFD